jgi:lipopolysaccharide/colanic/teichoic acid biosynthesis glycosyltransferase
MRLKRAIDLSLGLAASAATAPIVLAAATAIYAQDHANPFYVSDRVGLDGATFRFIKLRTMVVHADRVQIDTTVASDPRLTQLGIVLRRWKLDELPQFWHVVAGSMSLVGPRPNLLRETRLYSSEERRLLSIRPGITDLSSIVFSDLADILDGVDDANLAYNQRIRPWKSRLGLLYVDHASLPLDLAVLALTGLALVDRRRAIDLISRLVAELGGDAALVAVSSRRSPPPAAPPPGADAIVTQR